ncbi:MAG: 30S ribosomal protein S6 [Clostridia bacterium]|nr:30S ribosomal protein S6 [Clostridia bacterium]
MSSYETMFIVDMTIGEEAVKATIAKFTDLISKNGTVEEVNEWGSRKLAYPINDLNEGYYVIVNFKSAPDFPAELERIFGITEGIMRSVVIKLDEKMLAKKAARAAAAKAEAAEAVEEATDAE